jgi:hypothetical protein
LSQDGKAAACSFSSVTLDLSRRGLLPERRSALFLPHAIANNSHFHLGNASRAAIEEMTTI